MNKYKKEYNKCKKEYNKIKLLGGNDNEDKILGCLYGVAVGDALGTRYEFLESQVVVNKIENDMKDGELELLGGGPFKTEAGQISDDTEMMLCLLKSISTLNEYNQHDIANKYIEWYQSKPIDIGKTISKSLFTRKPSLSAEDMVNNSYELNHTSLSNGVLMRIAPIGIYAKKITTKILEEIVKQEASLTHPHQIIYDSALLYCHAIKYILRGINKDELYTKLETKCCITPRVKIILRDSKINPEPTYVIDDDMKEKYIYTDDKKLQGYFGIALQNAFFELFNGTDYNTSMINIIKRGGDTDTNCAIAGGLLGAFYGLTNINKKWLNVVKNSKYNRIKEYNNYNVNNINIYYKNLL